MGITCMALGHAHVLVMIRPRPRPERRYRQTVTPSREKSGRDRLFRRPSKSAVEGCLSGGAGTTHKRAQNRVLTPDKGIYRFAYLPRDPIERITGSIHECRGGSGPEEREIPGLQQLLERPKHGVRAVVVVKTAVVRWFWLRPVGYHPWDGPGADRYGGRGQTSEIPRFVTATIGLGAVGPF